MGWSGGGVFNRLYSWVADKAAAIDISSTRMDADTNDITANGFGNCLTRDGQGSATANLPMNGFRHTGVQNGVARSDYAALGQVEDGVINWAVAGGTSDAITATYTPALTALVDGQLCFLRASAANATTTPTFTPHSGTITAYTITKLGGTALVAGDIAGNLAEVILRYNLANTRWELLNPVTVAAASVGTSQLAANAVTLPKLANDAIPFGAVMINGTIVESNAGNAETYTIKTLAGATPSAADPVYFLFRDVTAATGDYTIRSVTAALSITIPSGQTMGFSNSTPARIWIGALDNAGTVELFVINALLPGNYVYPLRGWGIISTSAVSGASSAGVAYSSSARTSKPYLALGYATWEAGGTLATAGTWNVSPVRLQLYQAGMVPLPGDLIQNPRNETGAVATGTTTFTLSDSIPTTSSGDQYMSQAITPTSSANILEVESLGFWSTAGTPDNIGMFLFQDANTTALSVASMTLTSSSANLTSLGLRHNLLAATLSSTTMKIYAGGTTGATTKTFNGISTARKYGGTLCSFLEVRERMG